MKTIFNSIKICFHVYFKILKTKLYELVYGNKSIIKIKFLKNTVKRKQFLFKESLIFKFKNLIGKLPVDHNRDVRILFFSHSNIALRKE